MLQRMTGESSRRASTSLQPAAVVAMLCQMRILRILGYSTIHSCNSVTSLGLASSTSTITVVPSGASSVEVRRQGCLDHKRERGDGNVGHQSWQQRPRPSGPDALVVGGSSAALNSLGFNSSHNALAFYCFAPSCASCIFLN